MEDFGSYLKILTYNHGIRATSMAEGTGLSPAVFSKYFKSISVPDRMIFERILKYLSPLITHAEEMKLVDLYLETMTGFDMGYAAAAKMLDPLEQVIINKFRGLSEEQKTKVVAILDQMLSSNLDVMAENAGLEPAGKKTKT